MAKPVPQNIGGAMAHEKPAHEIRLGAIRVTIWANPTANGDVWFNVSVARTYKELGQWKTSTTYRRDDLPLVAKGVEMAYAWIWNQRQESHPSQANVR